MWIERATQPVTRSAYTKANRMLFLATRHREFMKKDQRIVLVVCRLTRSSLPKLTVYRPVGSPVIVPYIGVDMDSTLPAEFNLLCRPLPVQFANNFKELLKIQPIEMSWLTPKPWLIVQP